MPSLHEPDVKADIPVILQEATRLTRSAGGGRCWSARRRCSPRGRTSTRSWRSWRRRRRPSSATPSASSCGGCWATSAAMALR